MVGVSGDFGQRCSLITAKALNLPACTLPSVAEASRQDRSIWPPIKSCIAGAGAAIGHVLKLRADLLRKGHAAQLRGAAGADGAECGRLGLRLQPSDQFARRLRRHGVFAEDPQWRGGQQRDRLQIFQDVVIELVDRRRADMARPIADADRVAVRRGVDDAPGRDRAARAADGFDDDRLAERAFPCASASIRASVSVGPPGGKPTIMVIGCDG